MRQFIPLGYWLMVVITITLILTSLSYTLGEALSMAVMFLPGMFLVRYFAPQLSFTDRRQGYYHLACLLAAGLFLEYLMLMLTNYYLRRAGFGVEYTGMPQILANPLFLLLVLSAFVLPGMSLEKYLRRRYGCQRQIEFTSDRRKVSLPASGIAYIESNDSEVLVRTVSGETYRTKTRISQWENLLDDRFLRVHRSYIVNTDLILHHTPSSVVVGEETIEVSRKYRDAVRERLVRIPVEP